MVLRFPLACFANHVWVGDWSRGGSRKRHRAPLPHPYPSGNKLTRLPPNLGKCVALTEVLASDNRLVEVPTELGRLQKLQTLNLERNSLAVIPPAVLVGCICLQTLLLQGNPLTSEQLAATEGYADYEQRRQRKYDKVLATNVLTSGFTEAIDRDVAVT